MSSRVTSRRLRLPVPVTIITGALASGKTTAIINLLQNKPAGEVWAVLVNEMGAVGLDGALIQGAAGGGDSGVVVHQLAGGCLCCVLSNVTALAIAQLLRRVKPDRLIIEPSGLGHPASLIDTLCGKDLGSSLNVQPVVCMVDATQFSGGTDPSACLSTQLLADQISVADILVGSKADLCNEATLQFFEQWARQLFPPKQLVTTASRGCLGGEVIAAILPKLEVIGDGSEQPAADAQQQGEQQAPRVRRHAAGSPWLSSTAFQRHEVQDASGSYMACGWIFDRGCIFDRPRLLALLHLLASSCRRVKGVFRVAVARWESVSAAPGVAAELQEIAYRTDSRLEVIILLGEQETPSGSSSSNDTRHTDLQAELERDVGKALKSAAGGDWAPLERLVLATLQHDVAF